MHVGRVTLKGRAKMRVWPSSSALFAGITGSSRLFQNRGLSLFLSRIWRSWHRLVQAELTVVGRPLTTHLRAENAHVGRPHTACGLIQAAARSGILLARSRLVQSSDLPYHGYPHTQSVSGFQIPTLSRLLLYLLCLISYYTHLVSALVIPTLSQLSSYLAWLSSPPNYLAAAFRIRALAQALCIPARSPAASYIPCQRPAHACPLAKFFAPGRSQLFLSHFTSCPPPATFFAPRLRVLHQHRQAVATRLCTARLLDAKRCPWLGRTLAPLRSVLPASGIALH